MFGRREKTRDVLIVGAGPVGLFAALALAERGADVEVIDAQPAVAGDDYGVLLHPRTLELFNALGLVEPLIAHGAPVYSLSLRGDTGATTQLGLFATDAAFDHALIVRQADLQHLLSERLASLHVPVSWQQRLARFYPGVDDVVLTIDKLEQLSVGYAIAHTETEVTRTYDLRARFVIGADGQRSLLRRQLDIGYPPVGPTQGVAVFEGRPTDLVRDEIRLIFSHDTSATTIWPLPDGRCRWVFELSERPVELGAVDKMPVLQTGEVHVRVLPREAFSDYRRLCGSKGCPDASEISLGQTMYFEHRLADRFGSGRIWLAGDAGHAANASTGHSLNGGLQEAGALATRISAILEGHGDLEALRNYEREGRRVWRELLGLEKPTLGTDRAAPWLAEHARRVVELLPASGADRVALAGRLGIDIGGAGPSAAATGAAAPSDQPRWT